MQIVATNDPANQQGVRPGISLADARALFPNLVVKQANPRADFKVLKKLAQACERYSPWTAIDPLGNGMLASMSGSNGIWIDITGCAHLYNGEHPLVEDLHNHCIQAGYQPRIGLADTPGAAWAAARFSSKAYTIIPIKNQHKILASYPIAALRINSLMVEELENLGLKQICDLYNMPRGPLTTRFNDKILYRLDQMLGNVEEPILPQKSNSIYYARVAFAEPIGHMKDVSSALKQLLKELCLILEKKGLGVRRLKLTIFRVDNTRAELEIGTSQASRDQNHLDFLFRNDLQALDPGFGIEVLILATTETNPLTARQTGFTEETRLQKSEAYAKLIDRLVGRLGTNNVVHIHPIESHLPECANKALSIVKMPPPNNLWIDILGGCGSYQHPARPIQLLQKPLPIDVIAPTPGSPPVMFLWRKRQHKVMRAEGPERISPEWWKSAKLQTESKPLTRETRDYYRLEDQNGNRYWIYREGLHHRNNFLKWYLHGFFA